MQPFVISQIKDQISEITFGTPKSNSLPSEILEKLAQTILTEGSKPEVKAILLKSEGEKAFCAGASFDELLEINDLEASKKFFGGFAKVLNAMRTCGKIVVVRVQGKTTGNKINIAGETITLDAIVAAELYGNTESHSWSKGTNGGLVTPGVFAFSNSKNKIEPAFNYTPRNNQTFGVSGIINLAWREQVYLELTGRNDWLSTLTYPSYMVTGQNNYTVFYPSANLSWVFTETFKAPEWFSFGKLRASLARVGMGTSAYATTNGFGVFSQSSQYDPTRNSVLIANPNLGTAWNNDLKPEIQQSLEIGTDLRFFNENLTLDVAYYKTNTKNQIMSIPAVAESGGLYLDDDLQRVLADRRCWRQGKRPDHLLLRRTRRCFA